MWVLWVGLALGREPHTTAIPVPSAPPPSQQGAFDYCTTFMNAMKGRQKSVIETDDGTIGLRCEQREEHVRVCLVLDGERWPTRWPQELTCEVGRREFAVQPYPAWDPTWTLGKTIELRANPMSALQAHFELPQAAQWSAATVREPDLPLKCALDEGQLRVRVVPPSTPTEAVCVLTDVDGTETEVPVRLRAAR